MLKKISRIQLTFASLVLAAVATGLSYLVTTNAQCAHVACTEGINFTNHGWPAPITTNGGFNSSSTLFDFIFWFLFLLASLVMVRSLMRGTIASWLKRTTPALLIGLFAGLIVAASSLLITTQGFTNFSSDNQSFDATITQYGWPVVAYQTVTGAPAKDLDGFDRPGLLMDGVFVDVVFWVVVCEAISIPAFMLRRRQKDRQK